MPQGPQLARDVGLAVLGRRIHTVDDALQVIDKAIPKHHRHAPHWRRARELLRRALRSEDAVVVARATVQFERALREETGSAKAAMS